MRLATDFNVASTDLFTLWLALLWQKCCLNDYHILNPQDGSNGGPVSKIYFRVLLLRRVHFEPTKLIFGITLSHSSTKVATILLKKGTPITIL